MNKELSQMVRQSFKEAMRKQLPRFAPSKFASTPAGATLWSFSPTPGCVFFVMLCISPTEDAFTIEAGISPNACLPATSTGTPEEILRGAKSCGFRISRLWDPTGLDHWWHLGRRRTFDEVARFIPEDSIDIKRAFVAAQVDEAFSMLIKYCGPFFMRVEEMHQK